MSSERMEAEFEKLVDKYEEQECCNCAYKVNKKEW